MVKDLMHSPLLNLVEHQFLRLDQSFFHRLPQREPPRVLGLLERKEGEGEGRKEDKTGMR